MAKIAIIVAVVAVVVVAAAGGGYYLYEQNKKPSETYVDSYDLNDFADCYALVFGNANGDKKINADDVTVINDIIAGTKNMEDYPLADANCDGKITSADADIVNGIIGGTTTSVKVLDSAGKVVVSPYPITKMFFAGGVNSRVIMNALDLPDHMVAWGTGTLYGKVLEKKALDKVDADEIVQVTTSASDDDFTALSELDFNIAVIEDTGISGYGSDESRSRFASMNSVVLFMNFNNSEYSLQSAATLGVLVNNTDDAEEYIELMENVINTIDSVVSTKTQDQKPTVLSVTMSNSVSGTESDYYAATQTAGGVQLADWTDSTKKFDPSKGHTWLYESKYNADFLIHFKSQEFDVTDDANVKTAKGYAEYFSETQTFKNEGYYLMNGVIPLPARLAWMAEIMYDGEFEDKWGEKVFQDYVDKFVKGGDEIDVSSYRLVYNVATQLLHYTAPTEVTLTNEFLIDGSMSLGFNNSAEIEVGTNGNVYYPKITNSDPTIAKVTFAANDAYNGGTLTVTSSDKVGSTTITVTIASVVKTFTVNVADVPATAVALTSHNIEMGLTSASLSYDVTPANASLTGISFTSNDDTVVKIGDGYVTGLKAGTATVTVSIGDLHDECLITVTPTDPVSLTWTTAGGKSSKGNYKACMASSSVFDIEITVSPGNADTAGATAVSSDEDLIRIDKVFGKDGEIRIDFTKLDATTKKLVTITVTDGDLEFVANIRCNGYTPPAS